MLIYCAFLIAVAGSAVIGYTARTWPLPEPGTPGFRQSGYAILAADGSLIGERGQNGEYVTLEALPVNLIDAVLATEDRRFYQHFGVDPVGLARAAIANLRAGEIVQGGSTITQQLAKNLFLDPDRTWQRKLQELLLALSLEVRLSKHQILELYLNRAYFGFGAYGIEAAARRYFGKRPEGLTLAQAAMLAGTLKAPSRYAPTANPKLARARMAEVLQNMMEAGIITPAEARTASQADLKLKADPAQPGPAEHAIDWVMQQVPDLIGRREGRFVVETTIDARLQQAAGDILTDALATDGAASGASEAAAVVMAADGGVRALIGGRSYASSQFNRATSARRQPGSAFKSFVYLAALEAGYGPDSLVRDAPLSIGTWTPTNYTDRFLGEIPLQVAFARSVNTVAVRLFLEMQRGAVTATARRLGIRSPLHGDASLALGTAEVTPIELTAAHVAFANGGARVTPYVITAIRTPDGTVIYRHRPEEPVQVIAPRELVAMRQLQRAVVTEGTGQQARIPGIETGGKTGTSQSYRDAWFVGYAGALTGGVWVGNDDGTPMRKVTGGGLAARIWQTVMRTAYLPKDVLPPRYEPLRVEPVSDEIALLLDRTDASPPTVPSPATTPPAIGSANSSWLSVGGLW
jgi:penicillin-binding protein 1A